jgi:hypothetical protein
MLTVKTVIVNESNVEDEAMKCARRSSSGQGSGLRIVYDTLLSCILGPILRSVEEYQFQLDSSELGKRALF